MQCSKTEPNILFEIVSIVLLQVFRTLFEDLKEEFQIYRLCRVSCNSRDVLPCATPFSELLLKILILHQDYVVFTNAIPFSTECWSSIF